MKVGLMDRDGHREAKCVNCNVFLAPLDFLVPVKALAGRVGMVGSLHASGVNDSILQNMQMPFKKRVNDSLTRPFMRSAS